MIPPMQSHQFLLRYCALSGSMLASLVDFDMCEMTCPCPSILLTAITRLRGFIHTPDNTATGLARLFLPLGSDLGLALLLRA